MLLWKWIKRDQKANSKFDESKGKSEINHVLPAEKACFMACNMNVSCTVKLSVCCLIRKLVAGSSGYGAWGSSGHQVDTFGAG
jgi:hypothetical protein